MGAGPAGTVRLGSPGALPRASPRRAARLLLALLLLAGALAGCGLLPEGANDEDWASKEPTPPRNVLGIEIYDYGDPPPGT